MAGWRQLHPWAVRRGTLRLPDDIEPRLFTLLPPAVRLLASCQRLKGCRNVAVLGSEAARTLASVVLEGQGMALSRAIFSQGLASPAEATSTVRDEPWDGLVVMDPSADALRRALESAIPGARVVDLVNASWAQMEALMWDREVSLFRVRSLDPDLWAKARERLVEAAARLLALPCDVHARDGISGMAGSDRWTVVLP